MCTEQGREGDEGVDGDSMSDSISISISINVGACDSGRVSDGISVSDC